MIAKELLYRVTVAGTSFAKEIGRGVEQATLNRKCIVNHAMKGCGLMVRWSKEKAAEWHRQYYRRGGKEIERRYVRKFVKTMYDSFLGSRTCPKCGELGYAEVRKVVNIKTGVVHRRWWGVNHHHTENGVNVYDGFCYVGPVEPEANKFFLYMHELTEDDKLLF